MKRNIRVLISKPGVDLHERGAQIIARALRDAGIEVIYTELQQTPEMIVVTALQKDVDAIGISVHSGAHMSLYQQVLELMKSKGLGDRILFGDGIFSQEDVTALQEMGVGELFRPRTPTSEIVQYVRRVTENLEN